MVALGTITLGVIPLITGFIETATTASASPVNHGVWNYIWKPGTPLPKITAGYELVAWPVYAPGTTPPAKDPPMVTIAHATSTGKVVLTAGAATIRRVTSGGVVSLLSKPDGCAPVDFWNEGKKETTVGATFSRIKPVKASFTYSAGQSSSLEVGYSLTGKVGSFSGDGDVSVSTDTSESFAPDTGVGVFRYLSEFRYGKWYYICGSRLGTSSYYLTGAYEYASGAKTYFRGPRPSYKLYNCVYQEGNSTWKQDRTEAITFDAGFSVLGFLGSAQTGYDSSAQIKLHYIHQGDVCGVDDVPGGDPKEVGAATTSGK
jgi:hypothetical protein